MRCLTVILALLLAVATPAGAHDEPLPPGAVARLGTQRLRHADRVQNVALTPDGTAVLTQAGEGFARLWDARTGMERRRFGSPKAGIAHAALSPDGMTVAVALSGSAIVLYEIATGKERRRLTSDGAGQCFKLAWSADGKRLAAAVTKQILVWDARDGKLIRRVRFTGLPSTVAFAPDLARFVVGTDRNQPARLWDAIAGKELRPLEDYFDLHGRLTWSPDGKIVAGACSTPIGKGSTRSSLRLWDADTGKKIHDLAHGANGLAFSPDGKTLAAGHYHDLRLWDVATGKLLRQWFAHQEHVPALAFSGDGKTLASGGFDRRVRLWDVATGKERLPQTGHTGAVRTIAFSPDGKTLASGGTDRTLRLWDWTAPRERLQRTDLGKIAAEHWGVADLAYLPDGKALLTMEAHTSEKVFRLWDAATGQQRVRFAAGTHSSALVCSPDGETFLSADWDGAVSVWEPTRGKQLRRVGKGPRLIALSLSPDGRTVAWAGQYRAFGVRDLTTGKDRHLWSATSYQAVDVAYSPTGDVVAGATENGPIRFWDPVGGKLVAEWKGVPRGIAAIAFAPDGRLLAVAAQKEIVLWDVTARQEVCRFRSPLGDVRCLAFAPDGRVLASGQSVGTLLVWDVTGRLDGSRLPPLKLTATEQDAHWKALAGTDAALAHRAIWALAAAAPASLADFEKRLVPIPTASPEQIAQLIRDLDDEEFDRRQKAIRQLTQLGEGVAPALRRAVDAGLPPEARRRAEEVLRPLERPPAAERLRALRAVAVLNHAGSAEAVRLLRRLASGAPEAPLTRASRAALARRK